MEQIAMDSLLILTIACLVSAVVLVLLRISYISFFHLSYTPAHLPWAGPKRWFFARGRATFSSVFHTDEISKDAFNKYSKKGQYYVLPNLFTGPEIIVPPSQFRWFMSQPEDILNQMDVSRELVQAEYNMFNLTDTVQDGLKYHVLRRDAAKQLSSWIGPIVEEIQLGLTDLLGRDVDGWRDIPVYSTMAKQLTRTVNRAFVGLPLCRDQGFLHSSRSFGWWMFLYAAAINLLPRFLRPLFGPRIVASDTTHFQRMKEALLPTIRKRMENLENTQVNVEYAQESPRDVLQFIIEDASQTWSPNDFNATHICKAIVALTSVALQTSRNASTFTLFDLASSPSATENFAILRAEAESVLESAGGIWTQDAISRLVKHDSVIHESLRMSTGRAPIKDVLAPDGIVTPDGLHLPRGSRIGIFAAPLHYDADTYPDPTTYNPWRFANAANSPGIGGKGEDTNQAALTEKAPSRGPSMVTTSNYFHAFGHGRHACPGRFFAANQLKLLIAHIMIHYDIEPLPSRPSNEYLGGVIGPPRFATLRVRRRKERKNGV